MNANSKNENPMLWKVIVTTQNGEAISSVTDELNATILCADFPESWKKQGMSCRRIPFTNYYEQLTEVLEKARKAAVIAAKSHDDSGLYNLDYCRLFVPNDKMQSKVFASITEAGLRSFRESEEHYAIFPPCNANASNRRIQVETMCDVLKEYGYTAYAWRPSIS